MAKEVLVSEIDNQESELYSPPHYLEPVFNSEKQKTETTSKLEIQDLLVYTDSQVMLCLST